MLGFGGFRFPVIEGGLFSEHVDSYLLHALELPVRACSWARAREMGVLDWLERKMAGGYLHQTGFSFHGTYEAFQEVVDGYDDLCNRHHCTIIVANDIRTTVCHVAAHVKPSSAQELLMSLLNGVYAETPRNRSEIPQADLDIANKLRTNPLRWNGQFSPQLIQVLLDTYAARGSVVLDPFLGSGTVLLEAGRKGLSAYGTEINPAAVTLAQIYTFINVPSELRRARLAKVGRLLRREFLETLPLFQAIDQDHRDQSPQAIKSRFTELLPLVGDRPQRHLMESLIVLLDYFKPDLSSDKVFATWKRLERLVIELPFSAQPIEVLHSDARRTQLSDSSVDLIITSPPYINVFNYHQQYRASTETLGWDLLRVARCEIGSNRKHRSNRFLTVIQFCLDMAQALDEMTRVCRPGSRMILVVGRESTVRETPFYNGEIVAEIAHRALDLDLILKQERVFLNRFGQSIFEDILHFSSQMSTSTADVLLQRARNVARDVLEATYPFVPDKAKEGMDSALESIDRVQPSPVFDPSTVCIAARKADNVELFCSPSSRR